jgi:hypothetical protein
MDGDLALAMTKYFKEQEKHKEFDSLMPDLTRCAV